MMAYILMCDDVFVCFFFVVKVDAVLFFRVSTLVRTRFFFVCKDADGRVIFPIRSFAVRRFLFLVVIAGECGHTEVSTFC